MSDAAAVIEAKGIPITFVDGSTARIRFGLSAIKALEDQHGSTAAALAAVNGALVVNEEGVPAGKAYSMIWDLLRLGLRREKLSDDELEDLLDENQMADYMPLLMEALAQGMGGANKGPKGQPARTSRSRGKSSTTSPPSLSIAQTSSSGT